MDFFDWRMQRGERADEETERLASAVVDAALEVHRHLGPLMPERSYEYALSHELSLRGIEHVCQAPVLITYKERRVGFGRIDILVADRLIVELKAVEAFTDEHVAQVLTYLRLKKLRLGLLMNFNRTTLKGNIRRIVLDPPYGSS